MWQGAHPLQERAKKASVDASTSYALEFDQVEVGERWQVENLCVRANTTSPSRIDVYIAGGGWNHFVGQVQPAVKGFVYTLPRPFWVGEGRKLSILFVGGGATDELEAWATGLKWVNLAQGG